MSWLDWCILIIPFSCLSCYAIYSRKFVRGVVDYLAAGRIAGRYLLCVGDMAASLSVITLVAGCEQNYQTGFAVGFWSAIVAPVSVFLSLTGYCTYRWRETRCLSMGQFLELRYGSKFFRLFCASLRTIAEMITNAIGPAVATNFFIYFLDLPHQVMMHIPGFGDINLPCYTIIVVLCLALALLFILPGGRISLLITDSFQALLSYPIFVVIVGYIILNFSWSEDVVPVMWNRVPKQSFMNPYDVSELRDFNIFALIVSLCGSLLNRASWFGNDTTGAAKTPHEQKMAGVLGAWRFGLAWFMIFLLAVIVITFMNSPNFNRDNPFGITNNDMRQALSLKVLADPKVQLPTESLQDIAMANFTNLPEPRPAKHPDENATLTTDTPFLKTAEYTFGNSSRGQELTQNFIAEYNRNTDSKTLSLTDFNKLPADVRTTYHQARIHAAVQAVKKIMPEQPISGKEHVLDSIRSLTTKDELFQQPFSQEHNLDTIYLNTVRCTMGDTPEGRLHFQQFRSLYNQMMMPTLTGKIFPVGLMGLFCLLLIMLLVSTDDSRIFNASSTLAQDVVLPLFKGHITPKLHLFILRAMTVIVGLFFLVVSLLFTQLDYINMFVTIMCALWMGGAGPVMIGGLYSRFGNLTGAWCAIIFGSGNAFLGLLLQRNWADIVYPWLAKHDMVDSLDAFLRAITSWSDPIVTWKMDAVKFPINSLEISFISMFLSCLAYVIGSYATYKPYDLNKLLHRGDYADDLSAKQIHEPWTPRNILRKILGITSEYTKADRIITWALFLHSFVYGVLIVFVGTVLWNSFYEWPRNWWNWQFYFTSLIIPGIIGLVSTVWFCWGGIRDLRRLFVDLVARKQDENDNGQILRQDDKDQQ